MRRNLSWLFLAIAPLLFASCVMSKKPLSDGKTSRVDSRLIGTWREVKTDGRAYSMTIRKKPGSSNVMQWESQRIDSWKKVKVERFDVFTKPGKTNYISISLEPDAHLIGKYKTPDPNTFEIHLVDPWIVGKAVEDGKLKGEAKRNNDGGYNSVTLAEPPDKVIVYLEKNAATSYAESKLVFKRRGEARR